MGAVLSGCGDPSAERSIDVPELTLRALPPLRAEADPAGEPFGRITDLEIGEDGSVFVLDGLTCTVRVFDPEGAELDSFGGCGQGPGELAEPASLLWGPDGNLWVLDLGNSRLSVFAPEGEFVSTHRPSDLPIYHPLAVGFAETGRLRWVGLTSGDLMSASSAWIETEITDGMIRPLTRRELPFVEWPLAFEHRGDETTFVLTVPFSGLPLFGFDPAGRLWYTQTGDHWVHRWSTDGELDLSFGRQLAPTPVTAAARQEALASSEYEELRTVLGQAGVAEMISLIPDVMPYLEGFFFDDESNIWVIRAAPGAPHDVRRTIDIYDAQGTPVGIAHATLEADPRPRVRDGLLAAIIRDELGVESVVLYRIGQ